MVREVTSSLYHPSLIFAGKDSKDKDSKDKDKGKDSVRGARKLTGENLKLVWAEFSTIS